MSKHYHFIGIGGIGMGAIASLLLAKGYKVSGSDLKENQMTKHLKTLGAKVNIGHGAENINGAQIVVYSSAVQKSNVELDTAVRKGLKIMQRAELLAELMKSQIGITVAGAHGKTTTTSMIGKLLIHAGLKPTVAVGGIVNGLDTNAALGEGKYFVSEVDESDGTFLKFFPKYSVITNIDREHLDYYKDWDAIVAAYKEFIQKTDQNGLIFGCAEDKNLLKLLSQSKRKYLKYGLSLDNDIVAQNIVFDRFNSSYDCIYQGKKLGKIQLSVPGMHNVLNSLACVGVGLNLSIDFNVIAQSLKEFSGVQRRFQTLSEDYGVRVIDDYAHHPTEITATLKAAALVKEKRVIVIFQPHRYSRLKLLWEEFKESLVEADYVIVTDVYAASEEPMEGVSSPKFADELKKITNKPVIYLKKDKVLDHVFNMLVPQDLVITLGAGDLRQIAFELSEKLKNNPVKLEKIKV